MLHLLPRDFWHNSNRSGSLPPASGMRLLVPTQRKRLNEAIGVAFLSLGLFLWLSLVSYQSQDPSSNTSAGSAHPLNLTGYVGSYLADLLLQSFGLAAFAFPILFLLLAWKWLRSDKIT